MTASLRISLPALAGVQLAAVVAACTSGPMSPGTAARPLFVANNGSVTVYAAGDTGNSAPLITITGSNTRLYSPFTVARDTAGRLYVAPPLSDSITVYAPAATGNAAPIATIAGSSTTLASPRAIALEHRRHGADCGEPHGSGPGRRRR